jgi:hypothetical protein
MPLFTTANAREMAARSHTARRERAEARENALNLAPRVSQTSSHQYDNDEFIAKRLARVRKQLDRLDGMIEKETDPMKLDRLASAQARLAEQERILAGRPMPGSFRPKKTPERASWHRAGPTPIPDEPEPVRSLLEEAIAAAERDQSQP